MELSQEIQDILQKYRPQNACKSSHDDELIDVDKLDFSNDQTWLLDCNSTGMLDLSEFLVLVTDSPHRTRTFTRPKKKCAEFAAEEEKSISDEIDNYLNSSRVEKPLHFDLSQPITSSIFDKMLADTAELDSFQNMSPPSLMNSLCSSTFTNLMENSYIKNDPVLREIRDADYSGVIYHESEPPFNESITESCSSINTDVAETFVRRTLNSLNCTFNEQFCAENIDPNVSYAPMNGTYRKNKTFTHDLDKNDEKHNNSLNNTYIRNTPKAKSSLLIKKLTNEKGISLQAKIDDYLADTENEANRLSDELDEYMNAKMPTSIEKSLAQCSESSDSLDRLSSMSSSSKESKRMAEVDAIVERQERSLSMDVESTPNPLRRGNRLFGNVPMTISPITQLSSKEHVSDSEISSEDFYAVRSLFKQPSARNFQSLSNLKHADGGKRSNSNLENKLLAKPSSSSNLRANSKIAGSFTNLSSRKGGNTALRPRSMVLPNISTRGSDGDFLQREQLNVPQLSARANSAGNANATFVKPKTSNLPRPASTGIPRPASKIPGPRTSRLPLSKPKTAYTTDLNDGYY